MANLVVMYPKPQDPAHFSKYFAETHMPLVAKMPGLEGASFGPATGPDGGEGAFFWLFSGRFASIEAIQEALGSPEGKAAVDDIPNYATGGGPTILFVESSDG